jgi:hypothetical protein
LTSILTSLLSLRWFSLGEGEAEDVRRHALHYPLSPQPRVTALGWRFHPTRHLRCLPEWTTRELEATAPQALAASPADLLLTAALRKEGVLRLPDLEYPLVALLSPGHAPLTDAELDELYCHFGLPIQQQFRDSEGSLLAYDCEAGRGFHLAHPGAHLPGMTPREGSCPCGDPAPRLETQSKARAATGIL